jgi:hypothetical protein
MFCGTFTHVFSLFLIQGPEHSSCRIERFLQLSNDDPEYFPVSVSSECFIHIFSSLLRHVSHSMADARSKHLARLLGFDQIGKRIHLDRIPWDCSVYVQFLEHQLQITFL